jgi:hypothetical protein
MLSFCVIVFIVLYNFNSDLISEKDWVDTIRREFTHSIVLRIELERPEFGLAIDSNVNVSHVVASVDGQVLKDAFPIDVRREGDVVLKSEELIVRDCVRKAFLHSIVGIHCWVGNASSTNYSLIVTIQENHSGLDWQRLMIYKDMRGRFILHQHCGDLRVKVDLELIGFYPFIILSDNLKSVETFGSSLNEEIVKVDSSKQVTQSPVVPHLYSADIQGSEEVNCSWELFSKIRVTDGRCSISSNLGL